MEDLTRILLLVQFVATWTMVGIIWFVQVVHYPLFLRVGSPDFQDYHQNHTRLTKWIVGPPMLMEGFTAVVLLRYRPLAVPPSHALAGFLLLLVIWFSTALVQIPLHNRLAHGFESAVSRNLVFTNWLRTVAWSLRGLLTVWMVWKVGR
jgi:hypothetical protein